MVSNLDRFINKQEFWKIRVSVDLKNLKSAQAIDAVAAVMRDIEDMDEVREHAGASLGRISTDYAVEILEHDLMYSDDTKTRLFALVGLRVSTHSHVDTILLKRLADENEDGRIRQSACYNLAARHCSDVIPYAIQFIDAPFMSENTFLSSNLAVESLLTFKTPEALNAVIEWSMMILTDKSRPHLQREHAANYLMHHGDVRCETLLIEMIDHPIMCAKHLYAGKSGNHAVEALKRLHTPDAMDAVQAWEIRQQSKQD